MSAPLARTGTQPIMWIALGVTVFRCLISCLLGPGDAEALYAMYARHPQLGYLDHAPLIGWLLRGAESMGPSELGIGIGAPHGLALRLVPIGCWLMSLAATADLAKTLWPDDPNASRHAAIAFVVCPLFLIGGLAAAPDAPMSAAWLCALALGARAASPNRAALGSSTLLVLGVGACVGIACLSKYSGALLGAALLVFVVRSESLRRSPSAWLSAIVAVLVASPPLVWNAMNDWASIRHRLSWSQGESGFSLRNVGALVGGQLLYLTPLVAVVAIATLVHLWRVRNRSPALRLVALATFVPLGPLALLCLWSRVAEPHWLLPVWLALPAVVPGALGATTKTESVRPEQGERSGPVVEGPERAIWPFRPRFLRWTAGSALVLVALLHVHVLTDLAPRFLPASIYDPRFDLAHDLRGWPEIASQVSDVARREHVTTALALHWTTCAQLDLALRSRRSPVGVGCLTPERDDYDLWSPDLAVRRDVLYVVDARWTDDPNRRLPLAETPTRGTRRVHEIRIERGGRVVRHFELWR